MLPAHIIEEIRNRELEKRRRAQEDLRPQIELPLPPIQPAPEDESDRGVVIIDLGVTR